MLANEIYLEVKAIFDKLIPRLQPVPRRISHVAEGEPTTVIREVRDYVAPANGVFRYDNPIESGYNAPNNNHNFHFVCRNGEMGVI
jgi:hypothetical protein